MNHTIIDYVWIGGDGELRSKARVIHSPINNIDEIPIWNYDGSSTNQADGKFSEVFICPRRVFNCPFRKNNHIIVMCDTYSPSKIQDTYNIEKFKLLNEPLKNNYRYNAQKIFDKYADQKPWYGLEQEYFIIDNITNLPIGFDPDGKQGQYYCSVGGQNAFGRQIVEEHLGACLYAGIKISGINAEVAPGQWEFQIGPVEGIDAADQLWIARYILEKITEKYNVTINYEPKPLSGDWNGSGCHTNFSTEDMRADNGIERIIEVMEKLKNHHTEHMEVYGENNEKRMTGHHETSNYNNFTYGIANRKCSVRIPNETHNNKKGYFEDRRPAANMDPYLVTSKILETIMN